MVRNGESSYTPFCTSELFDIREMVPVQDQRDPLLYIATEKTLCHAAIYQSRYDGEHFILEGNTTGDHQRFRGLYKLDYTERDISDGAPYDVSASGEGQSYYFHFYGWSAITRFGHAVASDESVGVTDLLLRSFLRDEWRRESSLHSQALITSLRGLEEQEQRALIYAIQRELFEHCPS
jgi:hypothetical protein